MTERGHFEQFLFNPLSFETPEIAKSHAEALENPTPGEASILLLVRGFLMYQTSIELILIASAKN